MQVEVGEEDGSMSKRKVGIYIGFLLLTVPTVKHLVLCAGKAYHIIQQLV